MSEQAATPDSASGATSGAIASEQQRAADTESYRGVPISDAEMAEVWTAPGSGAAGSGAQGVGVTGEAQGAPGDPGVGGDATPSDDAGPNADTVSDPARDGSDDQDWSDEGGATPSGPATNTEPPD